MFTIVCCFSSLEPPPKRQVQRGERLGSACLNGAPAPFFTTNDLVEIGAKKEMVPHQLIYIPQEDLIDFPFPMRIPRRTGSCSHAWSIEVASGGGRGAGQMFVGPKNHQKDGQHEKHIKQLVIRYIIVYIYIYVLEFSIVNLFLRTIQFFWVAIFDPLPAP